jgi:hypothetical protein
MAATQAHMSKKKLAPIIFLIITAIVAAQAVAIFINR